MWRAVIQRARRSEVRARRFSLGRGSALPRPFINMLMCEWDEAGHGAPEDSLTKKLIPLM